MLFEAVWYNGWVEPPGYFLVDAVEGETANKALVENLASLTLQIRGLFGIDETEASDDKIHEDLYLLPVGTLISASDITRKLREDDHNPD